MQIMNFNDFNRGIHLTSHYGDWWGKGNLGMSVRGPVARSRQRQLRTWYGGPARQFNNDTQPGNM